MVDAGPPAPGVDPPSKVESASLANPTVALIDSPNACDLGQFIICWNTLTTTSPASKEVRGQYFDKFGQPIGGEFRVNQDTSPTDPNTGSMTRRLANSAQHTISYRADGSVLAVWTGLPSAGVFFTILPPGYEEVQRAAVPCLKGDVNGDGVANGHDIQPFVNLLLDAPLCKGISTAYAADADGNNEVNVNDIPCIGAILLGGFCIPTDPCSQERTINPDCNSNGVPDPNDIASGSSNDCNQNGIPDECDLEPGDPDGDGLISNDVNHNNVPDECEPDCNKNGVPDSKDIDDHTSNDVNGNGVPDECERDCNSNGIPDDCDVAAETSLDCNSNSIPDECEQDCNSNGVPDDCDIADETSQDCNSNGNPDECDLALGSFDSLDCNTNGIPDECDIAACDDDPACADCNGNHIPDACDIAAHISADDNENGIPDECDWEQFGRTGGSGNESGPDNTAAWETYYDWASQQCWGPNCETTGAEQFQSMIDKLNELGLPIQGPAPAAP